MSTRAKAAKLLEKLEPDGHVLIRPAKVKNFFITAAYGPPEPLSRGPLLVAAGHGKTRKEAWTKLVERLALLVEKKEAGALFNGLVKS